jgi:hypothetical protein
MLHDRGASVLIEPGTPRSESENLGANVRSTSTYHILWQS